MSENALQVKLSMIVMMTRYFLSVLGGKAAAVQSMATNPTDDKTPKTLNTI